MTALLCFLCISFLLPAITYFSILLKKFFFCLFTVYSVWSTAMHVFRSHTVSALSDLAKKTFLSEIVKYFNCLEFRKTWENKLLYPIDNIFQLSNRKSEISNSREHQLMFFYLYLFENSASVIHLSCFSVFVHLELKRKFVVVELYPFKTTTVKFYTRFQAKRLREYIYF